MHARIDCAISREKHFSGWCAKDCKKFHLEQKGIDPFTSHMLSARSTI